MNKNRLLNDKTNRIQRLKFIKSLIERNPKPSLNDLDNKLEKHLDYKNGFFVELGANDGYTQSNTFYLEYCKDWTGLLIEGIPDLYNKCKYIRLNSKVLNYACVDAEYKSSSVKMRYANLMSIVSGAMQNSAADDEHINRGLDCQGITNTYEVEVKAKTLTHILDENVVNRIDLLSLDVEGYEANVLRGLDFSRYKPKYICVEARFFEDVDAILRKNYIVVERLTHHDYLYQAIS